MPRMRFLTGNYYTNLEYYDDGDFRSMGAVKPYERVRGIRGTKEGRKVLRLFREAMREHFCGRWPNKRPKDGGWIECTEERAMIRVEWSCGEAGGAMVFCVW